MDPAGARRTVGAVAILAVVLAGCGGESADESTPTALTACPPASCDEASAAVRPAAPTAPSTASRSEPIVPTTSEAEPTAGPMPTPTPEPTSTAIVAADWMAPDPLTDEYMQRVLSELLQREYEVIVPAVERVFADQAPLVDDMDELVAALETVDSPTLAEAFAGTFEANAAALAGVFSEPFGPILVSDASLVSTKASAAGGQRCVILRATLDTRGQLTSGEVADEWVRMLEPGGAPNPTGWIVDNRGPVTFPEYECL